METQSGRDQSRFRALLESAQVPFGVREFAERRPVFSQGDASGSVMHIESGRVWLAVTEPNGSEAICGILGAGAFLGEDALVGRTSRPHTATAVTPTEVTVIDKDQMRRALRSNRDVSALFLTHLLSRQARLEADLCDQLLYSTEERLAHTLMVLADCDQRSACRCALPHVSQESMAEMVGTTRARVNRFLVHFKQLGFIEDDHGRLRIRPSLLSIADHRPRVASSH